MSALREACVALQLTHGRVHPDEQLSQWGSDGPVFLVSYVHVTYAGSLRLGLPEPPGDGELHYVEDLLFYDGRYYGDWSVLPASEVERDPGLQALVQPYDAQKASLP